MQRRQQWRPSLAPSIGSHLSPLCLYCAAHMPPLIQGETNYTISHALNPPPAPARLAPCRPVVEHTAGICRIAPPPEWVAGLAAEFSIDRSTLKFNARVQRVDQLQRKHTAVASQRFWNEYQAWMASNSIKRKGGKLNPVFGGKEIELDRLHAIVQRRGGYTTVTEERGWREVANVLDVSGGKGVGGGSMAGWPACSRLAVRGACSRLAGAHVAGCPEEMLPLLSCLPPTRLIRA